MQRPEQHTLFRVWALLSFIWHQNDTFALFSIFFPIPCWLFWLSWHTDLMISVNCWWTQCLFPELQLLLLRSALCRHSLDYFSLDVLLPYIQLQWRSSGVTFCPLTFVISFWSALLLPSDRNELSIICKLGDFVKSCLKEHGALFCGYTVLNTTGSLILGWTAGTVFMVISI